MSEPFNVNDYWLRRGQTYLQEGLPQQFHRLQERFLLDLLKASGLPLNRILEIGCGFGRITRLLAQAFPQASITAVDLSPDQLLNAKNYCGNDPRIRFEQYDFYSGAALPGGDYDVAVAIEVLLHHPRPMVCDLLRKLSRSARHLVNVDWSEEWRWKTPEHVWVHDYGSIYAEVGLESVAFELPEKVDGLQQKLFVATQAISPTLRSLEQQARKAAAAAQKIPASTANASAELPAAALWSETLERAIQDIRRLIPRGSEFILVNDDQWGSETRLLSEYRVWPLLERDGQYWGPPPDDETAVSEMVRLRHLGASYIVFAWSSFWWLKEYAGFHQHLRNSCALLLENERLIIFQLPDLD